MIYRVAGVDPDREQPWNVYALSLLAFSAVSIVGLFLLQRLQGALLLNPTEVAGVPPALAFNTAVSFVTNTNWQNYGGESTMSHLTQMAGLTVQNFVVGRGRDRRRGRARPRARAAPLGDDRQLLGRPDADDDPRAAAARRSWSRSCSSARASSRRSAAAPTPTTVEGATQTISRAPVASQEAIKELGTNGGGIVQRQLGAPVREPERRSRTSFEIWAILAIPFALTFAFGRLAGDQRQGWALFAAMFALWIASAGLAIALRDATATRARGARRQRRRRQHGGQGGALRRRRRPASSPPRPPARRPARSTRSRQLHADRRRRAAREHDARRGRPGGVGAGLYGMLVFALLAVFIAGLMVGRTPEYLGKKIQAREMKLVVLYMLVVPAPDPDLRRRSRSCSTRPRRRSSTPARTGSPRSSTPSRRRPTTTARRSAASPANTDWYNTTLGLAMLVGRFLLIVAVLAIAGSLARKQPVPVSAGTFPTGTPLFAGLLVGVVLIVVGLTYFPVLSLGPVLEQLSL